MVFATGAFSFQFLFNFLQTGHAPHDVLQLRNRTLQAPQALYALFYMATIMGMLMCSTIVAISTGFSLGYAGRVFKAYSVAMPIAFCCVLLLKPLVSKLVVATVVH